MSRIAAIIMAVVLWSPEESVSRDIARLGAVVREQDVRTKSAELYSELLRLACANGWKFGRREVASGFARHFDELRQILIDRGETIVPLDQGAELDLTELAVGSDGLSSRPGLRACYKGRWRMEAPGIPHVVRAIMRVAD